MITYGIDFGTSNSLLGAANESGPLGFIPMVSKGNAQTGSENPDSAILRSLIYFPNSKEVYFGNEALSEFNSRDHTGRFIRSIKKQLPSRSFIGTFVDNRPFNLEDLIGVFLGEMRKRANSQLGEDVTQVILGRPARFAISEEDDRYAEGRLERAARIAGFTKIEFFPEPVAAAFGYGQDLKHTLQAKNSKLILAADYGGGTSDFTLYRLGADGFKSEDVLAMGGVSVAGDALDASLMRHRISPYFGTGVQYQVPFGSNHLTMPSHLMERICHPAEISLLRRQDTLEFFRNVKQWALGSEDREKMDRLMTLLENQVGLPLFETVEATKRRLSGIPETQLDFSYPDIEIHETITRTEFESYALKAFNAMDQALDETLKAAQISADKIDLVLCTGGTGRVPWIRNSLTRRFGESKLYDLDPFRGVASGLMARAAEVSRHG